MCAVRQLTEGQAPFWGADQPGQEATGVVLRRGVQPAQFSDELVPFVELWLGGADRVRVTAWSSVLRAEIEKAELFPGT